MDERRQRLLERKLGDRLLWQKPDIAETIGPYDPSVFDVYEQELKEAGQFLQGRLADFSDEDLAVISGERDDDPEQLRKTWARLGERGTERRLPQPPPWYAGGFGHPDHQADFDYWSKMPSLGVSELTCLTVGIDPGEFDARRLDKLAKDRDRAGLWPSIKFIVQRYELMIRKFGGRADSRHFVSWADRVNLEMPSKFRQLMVAYHAPSSLRKQDGINVSKTDKREVDSIAQLFTAMAIDGYGYSPQQARSQIPSRITDIAAGMGLEISTETIRKYLKRGAEFIPEDWQRD